MSAAMDEAADRATISVNGKPTPWTGQTVTALLADAGIAPERGGIAVALNGTVVSRGAWDATAVRPGDKVEIVHIVRGG